MLAETGRLFLRVLSAIGLLGALYWDGEMLYQLETTAHPGRWNLVTFSRNLKEGYRLADGCR